MKKPPVTVYILAAAARTQPQPAAFAPKYAAKYV